MLRNCSPLLLLLLPCLLAGQDKSDLRLILDRLERLERENHDLAAEVHALRREMAESRAATPDAPPIEEKVAVAEHRIDDLAQSKVEASQRLPITLTGMVLFNAYANGKNSAGQQYPVTAARSPGMAGEGATLRQSLIGMKFQGPEIFGGGRLSGTIFLDLFANGDIPHLRTATMEADWKTRNLMIGQDKPIIAPREPTSLARVGLSPLTGAGNLWFWDPQIRFEQQFALGESSGVRAQVGVFQTSEPTSSVPATLANTLSQQRPGLEGRVEVWHDFGAGRKIEIAPGFHTSRTHVAGTSVPSDLFSLDWMIRPFSKLEFTGAFFQGTNAAGLGGLRQGFTVFSPTRVVAIGAIGGWGQFTVAATRRLSFNLMGGEESNRAADLRAGAVNRNLSYAGNAMYRLGSNLLIGLEASQVRTTYVGLGTRLNNHYDLGFAYLF